MSDELLGWRLGLAAGAGAARVLGFQAIGVGGRWRCMDGAWGMGMEVHGWSMEMEMEMEVGM